MAKFTSHPLQTDIGGIGLDLQSMARIDLLLLVSLNVYLIRVIANEAFAAEF